MPKGESNGLLADKLKLLLGAYRIEDIGAKHVTRIDTSGSLISSASTKGSA